MQQAAIDRFGQPQYYRPNEINAVTGTLRLHLVALQLADQMPAQAEPVRERLGLGPQCLRSTFPQIPAACSNQRPRDLGRHILRGRHHATRPPLGGPRPLRPGDAR